MVRIQIQLQNCYKKQVKNPLEAIKVKESHRMPSMALL